MVNHGDTADLPDAGLPPLPIGGLVVGALEVLEAGYGLPQPHYITVSETQSIGLQLAAERRSRDALVRWTLRFGGRLIADPVNPEDGSQMFRLSFDYYGVDVQVYAQIPA